MRTQSLAAGAVSAIIGTRFYVGHIFSEATFPLVQMRATGGEVMTNLVGESGLQNRTFQLDCYAREESVAADLAQKVRASLTGQYSAFRGIGVGAAVAFYEEEHRAHRLTFEISVWF